MSVSIIAPSNTLADPFIASAQDYVKRTRLARPVQLKIVKDKQLIELANNWELNFKSAHCIALSPTGQQFNSNSFSEWIQKRLIKHKSLVFFIGAANGLPDSILSQCNEMLSLSSLTFPHRLALCVLAEQIYRAGEIQRGSPYHK